MGYTARSAVLGVAGLACLLAVPCVARADTIVLTDGRKLEGTVKEEGDEYVVRLSGGIVTRFAKHQVVSITKSETAHDVFTKMRLQVENGDDSGNANAWFVLGNQAKEMKLVAEAKAAYQRAVEIDPLHEAAHHALGHVFRDGTWVAQVAPPAQDGAIGIRQEAPPASPVAGGASVFKADESRVQCPKCSGKGVELWITCNQCKRSKKPGYLYHGEYMSLCNRCNGTGKLPGLQCRYCKGYGTVEKDYVPKERTRVVPGGYRLCTNCQGTGVDTWLDCNQCKRSGIPGVLNMGDRYQLCNRCGGKGKLPGLRCGVCAGHGIVPDKSE